MATIRFNAGASPSHAWSRWKPNRRNIYHGLVRFDAQDLETASVFTMVFIPLQNCGSSFPDFSTIIYCLAPEADQFITCGTGFRLLAKGGGHLCATGCVDQVISEKDFQEYYDRFTQEETLSIDELAKADPGSFGELTIEDLEGPERATDRDA